MIHLGFFVYPFLHCKFSYRVYDSSLFGSKYMFQRFLFKRDERIQFSNHEILYAIKSSV